MPLNENRISFSTQLEQKAKAGLFRHRYCSVLTVIRPATPASDRPKPPAVPGAPMQLAAKRSTQTAASSSTIGSNGLRRTASISEGVKPLRRLPVQ